jgi:TIR domain-containing protein
VTQVFLNYRADDEPFGVAFLDTALSARFGSDTVFLASKSIPVGEKWEERIFDAVAASAAMLAIIGRGWLSLTSRRRLNEPKDFVRREILAAMNLDKPVIPVRLGVPRLKAADLPPALQPLAGYEDIEIRFRSHKIDIDKLAADLAERIPQLPDPTSPASAQVSASAPSATTSGVNVGTRNAVFNNVRAGGDIAGGDIVHGRRRS